MSIPISQFLPHTFSLFMYLFLIDCLVLTLFSSGLCYFWLPLLIHKMPKACPTPRAVVDQGTPGMVGRLERQGERTHQAASSAVPCIPVMLRDGVTSVPCGTLPPFAGELMIQRQTDRWSRHPTPLPYNQPRLLIKTYIPSAHCIPRSPRLGLKNLQIVFFFF